ncbi:MAG: cyclase family protein [Rhabdochlamydiaceae bacterium]|nr:cyclase family protein [Candidatus Amphrikana amoebophyrae]
MFSNCKIIDLTHSIDDSIATWNGSCGFQHEVKLSYEQAGICVQKFEMHAGIGTHMDAPTHFFEHGESIGQLDIAHFFAPLICIDLSAKVSPTLFAQVADIRSFEKTYGDIPKGAFVALYTSWSKYWFDSVKYRNEGIDKLMAFPGYSSECAELLLERGVVGIGIDTLSPDGSNMTTFPVHKHILGAGLYIVENMKNLNLLPPVGAFIANLPMKIEVGSESAIRSVGFIPDNVI